MQQPDIGKIQQLKMISEGQILGYCQSKQKHTSGTLSRCSLFDPDLPATVSVWMCQTYETILCVIMSQKLSIGSRPIVSSWN